jgi:hypothetical protein
MNKDETQNYSAKRSGSGLDSKGRYHQVVESLQSIQKSDLSHHNHNLEWQANSAQGT